MKMKYSTYTDINVGDMIKFTDGRIRTVTKVKDSHKVCFDNEEKYQDLYIIENLIEEVFAPCKFPKVKPPLPISISLPLFDDDSLFVENSSGRSEDFKTFESSSSPDLSYSDLFSLMDKGDKSTFRYSKHFWQYTSNSNLVAIIKDGYFRSRYNVEGNIPYDLREHNSTEKDVLKTNRSRLTIRHVRFYLRPLNMPFFNAFNNLPFEEKKNFAIVSIKRDALFASYNSTFLYPFNAHSATDDVYQKKNELNHKYSNKFKLYKYSDFDFDKIYSKYDPSPSQDSHTKWCQQAEFMVWKDLNIKFIDKIYFYSRDGMDLFLLKIKDLPIYNSIKEICTVDSKGEIFGYTYDSYY